MSQDPLPDPSALSRSESLFAVFLRGDVKASSSDFEALCRAHPDLADELRQLDLEWKRVRSFRARAGLTGDARSPLADQLRSRFGDDVDPSVSLEGSEAKEDSGPSTELLRRLKSHAPADTRYKLLGEVARGGMGAILRVWDEDLRRTLAMKVVLGKEDKSKTSDTSAVDSRRLGRFLEEAQVTGQLDHPGIVPVHELGLGNDGRVYFTMRLVKGIDLKAVFDLVFEQKEGWNQTRALGDLLKVCEAMSYAHDKKVIHRDLKPANIMVGKYGEVYVMDWGLARVLGEKDRHDLRLKPVTVTSASMVRTERRAERHETPDSPLVTMDGDVMGTPSYMAPEQARGELENLGPQSDVYSVGAMLYHLVGGETPFVAKGVRVSQRAILMRVIDGPPKPLIALAPRAPAELVAICERAMARETKDRYRDMRDLAEDLRAYLERRVVRAYETGTWAETKKWVQRNKPLAAALAGCVLIAALGLVWVSVKNSDLARSNADFKEARNEATERAAREEKLKNEAIARDHESRLRGLIQDLQQFEALDDTLDEARKQKRPASEWWLAGAHELIDGSPDDPARGSVWKPGLADAEAQLRELRKRALAPTADEIERDQALHPRAKELAEKRARVLWHSRMLGLAAWPNEAETEAELAKIDLPADAGALNGKAWPLVDPDTSSSRLHGDEVTALLLARRAVDAAAEADKPKCRDTLAWALFQVSRFDDALAEEQQAAADIGESKRAEYAGYVAKLEHAIETWRGESARATRVAERIALAAETEALEHLVNENQSWRFADSQDNWWHTPLTRLVNDLKRLQTKIALAERSVGTESAKAWSEAIAAISASEKYRGVKWPNGERVTPQLGLVPIGFDAQSGLWEFADLSTGVPPARDSNRKLVLTPETGLVFVLLPGGHVPVEDGQQPTSINTVELDPFFLSKFEMTTEQWTHVSEWKAKFSYSDRPRLPANGVSWEDCAATLERVGAWVGLPTEVQWEYGCRGGTTWPWWTGEKEESLKGAENVRFPQDNNSARLESVGQMLPNPFGLYDVHGNVWEWCRDEYGAGSEKRRPGDGEREVTGAWNRVIRGGSFINEPDGARSSDQGGDSPDFRYYDFGVRPARGITP